MLDSAEHARLPTLNLTCIEPYPERLPSLMRPGDTKHVNVIDRPVQDVPEEIVDSLQDNDILFIDSTHVMKTGSDVHYEFFHLLPRLKPGVVVHFHDCGFPFEYPDEWIFELNYSWNEVYALRAFSCLTKTFECSSGILFLLDASPLRLVVSILLSCEIPEPPFGLKESDHMRRTIRQAREYLGEANCFLERHCHSRTYYLRRTAMWLPL